MDTLIASADDRSVDGPATAGYPLERLDIATLGHRLLAARGIAAEAATYDQLAGAYEQAEAELAGTAPRGRMTGAEALDFALNTTAETILAEQGKSALTCTEAEFVAAVAGAERRLGRSHRSIR